MASERVLGRACMYRLDALMNGHGDTMKEERARARYDNRERERDEREQKERLKQHTFCRHPSSQSHQITGLVAVVAPTAAAEAAQGKFGDSARMPRPCLRRM